MTDPSTIVDEVRRAIDEADTILLKALAARFRAVRHLRAVKKVSGIPVEDVARERVMKESWKEQAKELQISPELALLMLDFILAESKKIQGSHDL